jgi:hypothetical protein
VRAGNLFSRVCSGAATAAWSQVSDGACVCLPASWARAIYVWLGVEAGALIGKHGPAPAWSSRGSARNILKLPTPRALQILNYFIICSPPHSSFSVSPAALKIRPICVLISRPRAIVLNFICSLAEAESALVAVFHF